MNLLSLPYLELIFGSSVFSWIFSKRTRPYLIAACNAVFLYLLRARVQDWVYVLILTGVVYLCSLIAEKTKKRKLFDGIGIGFAIVVLALYKYYLPSVGFLMPLGISFYTFKALSYLADHIGKKAEFHANPVYLFDYLCFFPVFTAGPIHRAQPFFDSLSQPFVFEYRDTMRGAALVLFGAFEKFVISGTLAQYYAAFLDPSLSGWNTVFGVVLYGLYLYSDFDAYSSIAIGTARLLGFRLDANFLAPYLSSSMNEFWRRWHISLGSWLRDYVYIPLGGSRKGFLRKQLNILIVFLVSGIWHGNTLMFVIWGLGCGIVCVIDNLIAWLFQKAPKAVLVIGKILGIVINDGLVLALWVFFFSSDLSSALDVFSRMRTVFDGAGFAVSFEAAGLSAAQGIVCLALIAVIVVTDVLRYFFVMSEKFMRWNIVLRWAVYAVMIAAAIVFGNYGPGVHPADFVYERF